MIAGALEYDEFGPEMTMNVYDPATGMRGSLVIDNTVLGPGKGGIRMTPTVTLDEVQRLARTMTWKNALAGLPFGGAKSGIMADPKGISMERKKALVQAFARALKVVSPEKYIAAPDMNIAEQEIAWYVDANGSRKSATGKPRSMGGLPHELGSTGFGVFHAASVAAEHAGLDMSKATVAIEGFGNVGAFAARYLSEAGAKLVAVSDSKGVIYNGDGLDFRKLSQVKMDTGTVINYRPGTVACCESILLVDADMLITAAIPDLIGPADVARLKFRVIVEGSNIPMTHEAEERAHSRGILVVPDFVANAGGVISSYVEHIGGTEKEMFRMVEKRITENTRLVLRESERTKDHPRDAALAIAKESVRLARDVNGRAGRRGKRC